jgi:hypothetical protein
LRRLLVTANIPSSPILVTLMMEALISSETSVLTRATRRNVQEDSILHSHRRKTLISYTTLLFPRLGLKPGPLNEMQEYRIFSCGVTSVCTAELQNREPVRVYEVARRNETGCYKELGLCPRHANCACSVE